MPVSPTILVQALTYGSILALLSLGVTIAYITTRVFNFAHPRIAIVSAYMAATFLAWLAARMDLRPETTEKVIEVAGVEAVVVSRMPLWWALSGAVVAALVGVIVSLTEYYVILRPLYRRRAGFISLMIATLGFDFVLLAGLTIYAILPFMENYSEKVGLGLVSEFLSMSAYDLRVSVGGVKFKGIFIWGLLMAVGTSLALYILLFKTKLGIKLRAAVENPALAMALGVNVERVYAIAWGIAGATAGLAGFLILFGPDVVGKRVTPTSPADEIIVSVFAGSIVGGMTSLFGSIGGGMLIGLVEQLMPPLLDVDFKYAKVFSMSAVVVTLLFMPKGLASLPETRVGRLLSLTLRSLASRVVGGGRA